MSIQILNAGDTVHIFIHKFGRNFDLCNIMYPSLMVGWSYLHHQSLEFGMFDSSHEDIKCFPSSLPFSFLFLVGHFSPTLIGFNVNV